MKLKSHPRLYVPGEALDHAVRRGDQALDDAQAGLEAVVRAVIEEPMFAFDLVGHNAHLIRARHMQTRIVSLLVRWRQTRDETLRDLAVEQIRQLIGWDYWSWITWRKREKAYDAIFDLSYGENSATLAIAWDWLHDALSDDERAMMIAAAQTRSFQPFLKHTDPAARMWWFGKKDTNWNTVCAGGAGMLALAMGDVLDDAALVLERAEESVAPFMKAITEFGGGWPEGIGYWNYGMRYAWMYLLSHENATGRRHPLLRAPAVKASLTFPLDFTPCAQPCSFGDVNAWAPMPFHYAAADRLGADDVIAALDHDLALRRERQTGERAAGRGGWPNDAELILLYPRKRDQAKAKPAARVNASDGVIKTYRGLQWWILADRLPDPALYASVRGGSTEVPHNHLDLLSFHAVIDGEKLFPSIGAPEYLDSTFSPRRFDIPELGPLTKNTILINAVGHTRPAKAATREITVPGAKGVRLDLTGGFGGSRDNTGGPDRFVGRLVLLVKRKALLVIDRVELHHEGRIETRLHADGQVAPAGDAGFDVTGKRAAAAVRYAADVPALTAGALTAPSRPQLPCLNVLRWAVDRLESAATFATLIVPGKEADGASVTVEPAAGGSRAGLVVSVSLGGRATHLKLSRRLLAAT